MKKIVFSIVALVLALSLAVPAVVAAQEPPGTGTPGYWKHNPDAWPVPEIMVGGPIYTPDEAILHMESPVRGDKTLTMFNALVAAKLNVLAGNDNSCIADAIVGADEWMAEYPVGSGVRGNSDAWELGEAIYEMLDEYNNGYLCAPSRDDFDMEE
jgi:hypothetical protein